MCKTVRKARAYIPQHNFFRSTGLLMVVRKNHPSLHSILT